MKIRNGFVSNSSTSSFILIGWIDKEFDYKEAEKLGMDYYRKERLLGVGLPSSYDDGDVVNFSLSKLEQAIQKAKDLKVKLGFDEDPQLIYGTIMN
jgi:hypothetical protein